MIAEIDHDLDPANAKEFIVGHSDDLEEAEFLDSQFNNHAESLHKSLTELKHLLNEIDLENI